MDSSGQEDRLSSLPNALLILIISCLHFKDCVRTSVLSKRWRYLYLETRNVAFRESDFVKPTVSGEQRMYARMAFVDYASQWLARIRNQPIDSFEICISNPLPYMREIRDMIESACCRSLKNLVLDFSHPSWRIYRDLARTDALPFEVPGGVYILDTLETLKVCAVQKFDPSRLWNPGKFKSLSFGWMALTNLGPLLSETSRLESLDIHDCWGIDVMTIAGNMREFAFKNCFFPFGGCRFNLPRVDVFKYTGDICYLEFERMNSVIREVHLDVAVWGEHRHLKNSPNEDAELICELLHDLRSAETLTVTPFLLQVIQRSDNPTRLLRPVETQHLVLKTQLHPQEFNAIRLILDHSPNLETLTFDMLPPYSTVTASSYNGIEPRTYWMENVTYNSLGKTVKSVVVKNFVGSLNELNVLWWYMIRSGSVA